jgi:hypothetical protein
MIWVWEGNTYNKNSKENNGSKKKENQEIYKLSMSINME